MGEDSSNPLIPYSYLAGIVSFGLAKCGAQGVPGVYTVSTSPQINELIKFNLILNFLFLQLFTTEGRPVH